MKKNNTTDLRKRWEDNLWGLSQIGIYITEKERTDAYSAEASVYCTQNKQMCSTCSLVNYGTDCHNLPVH